MQVNSFTSSIKFYTDDQITGGDFLNNHTSNKNVNFFICQDSSGNKLKAFMNRNYGLGTRKYSDIYNYAFTSGTKAYYSLIYDSKPYSMTTNQQTYWSGYYQFTDKEDIM